MRGRGGHKLAMCALVLPDLSARPQTVFWTTSRPSYQILCGSRLHLPHSACRVYRGQLEEVPGERPWCAIAGIVLNSPILSRGLCNLLLHAKLIQPPATRSFMQAQRQQAKDILQGAVEREEHKSSPEALRMSLALAELSALDDDWASTSEALADSWQDSPPDDHCKTFWQAAVQLRSASLAAQVRPTMSWVAVQRSVHVRVRAVCTSCARVSHLLNIRHNTSCTTATSLFAHDSDRQRTANLHPKPGV